MRLRSLALVVLAACSATPKRLAVSPEFAPQVRPLATAWANAKRESALLWHSSARDLAWASAMRLVAAERAGDVLRLAAVTAEHEALIDDMVAVARAGDQPLLVQAVLILERDVRRHAEDLAWARAPVALSAIVEASRSGDDHALTAAIDAAVKADDCDTWLTSLQALAHGSPPFFATVRQLARIPRTHEEPEPRALAIALRANDETRGSSAHPLIAAQALLDSSDPVDAALLIDRLPEADRAGPVARALRAKAALALGDAAAYLAWRPPECTTSPSLIAYEARFHHAPLPEVDAIARAAMMRSLTTTTRYTTSIIASPSFSADDRHRALERLRAVEPGRAAWGDGVLHNDVDAVRAMHHEYLRPTFKAVAGARSVDGLPRSALLVALSPNVLGTPEQLSLMNGLDHSRYAGDEYVALMHVFVLMRERKLDEALALLNDPATPIADEDILACVLGVADIGAGKLDPLFATSAGVRSFLDSDHADPKLELDSWRRSTVEEHHGDALFNRLMRGYMLTGTVRSNEAAKLYEGLMATELPPRARAELVARVVLAYVLADDLVSAQRFADAHPEVRGSFHDLVIRGYLGVEQSPAQTVLLLGEAAGDARTSSRMRAVFAYALVKSGADTEGFAARLARTYLREDESVPADASGAMADLAWPWRSLASQTVSPMTRDLAQQRFRHELDHATTNAQVEAAASAYVQRGDPDDPVTRAWFSVMAGDNGAVFEAMRLPRESPHHLDEASEVFLLGAERTQSQNSVFDALAVREQWNASDLAAVDKSKVERVKVRPQTPEGNEYVCRVLMRLTTREPAAPYCISAYRAGRHDQSLRDHMAWIAMNERRLPASDRFSADELFHTDSGTTSYGFEYWRAWWLMRAGHSREAAKAFRDGVATLEEREYPLDPTLRSVVVVYDGPLMRGLYPTKPLEPHFHSIAMLSIESSDLDAARLASHANPAWMRGGADMSAIIDDYVELVDDDLKAKRVSPEDVAKAVVTLYDRRPQSTASPDALIVKLAQAQAAFIEHDNAKAATLIDDVAKAHLRNITVARLQVRILVAHGSRDSARARLEALELAADDPRRLAMQKIIDGGKNMPISDTL